MTWGPIGGGGGGTSSATYTVTDALILGAATTSGVRLEVNSGYLEVREGDDSAGGDLFANELRASNAIRLSAGSGANPFATMTASGFGTRSTTAYNFSSGSDATTAYDTGLARSAAGVVKVTDGSTGGGKLMLSEVTAPTGTANSVILYAEDNGSGKTRLMAIFGSGAAQQVAIEP